MVNIYLLCGYSKTGKDTFYHNLYEQKYNWLVYGKTKLILPTQAVRLAFADNIKIEAAQIYNIPYIVNDKDNKQFTHYITGKIVSARDIYIECAAIRKQENIYYWVKQIVDIIIQYYSTSDIIITDWRFQEEIYYLQ